MDYEQERVRVANLPFTLPKHLTELLDGYKRAIHEKNTSAVYIIDGRSGMGKTTLALQVASYLDANFSLSKIHYDPQSFLEGSEDKIGLQQMRKGEVIVFDEAMLISNRATLSYINRMIVQAMSMIRSKNIFVIFCVNSIFDLDKNLALSRADLLLHVYGSSLTDRGKFMAFFKGSDDFDRLKMLYLMGKKYYDYGKPKSNFFSHFPKHFAVDELEYERQKQIGVNNFLAGMTEKGFTNKFKEQRDRYVRWIKENHEDLSMVAIAQIGKVTDQTIYNILNKEVK